MYRQTVVLDQCEERFMFGDDVAEQTANLFDVSSNRCPEQHASFSLDRNAFVAEELFDRGRQLLIGEEEADGFLGLDEQTCSFCQFFEPLDRFHHVFWRADERDIVENRKNGDVGRDFGNCCIDVFDADGEGQRAKGISLLDAI